MRDTTERPEALDAGTVKLVGTDDKLIIEQVSKLIENKNYYNTMAQANYTNCMFESAESAYKYLQLLMPVHYQNDLFINRVLISHRYNLYGDVKACGRIINNLTK